MNKITGTNIFIGDMWSASDENYLKINNVTHVLNMTPIKLKNHKDIIHHNIELDDTIDQDILNILDESFEFINTSKKENGNILVHCQAGVSRSASIVIAYLMARENITYNNSLEHVRKDRPIICPNKGFVRQLLEFEKTISIVI